ncbi:uncharacterized protein LOC116139108 [Pistacia vera]|uniref:uncharacterized protein LOC116139108 n=1 Tax=Pistacia vera TaxID=55513 RepID=UPI001262D1CA|nr:uncharacterized protein LOC116139108 [Pistacia vera]
MQNKSDPYDSAGLVSNEACLYSQDIIEPEPTSAIKALVSLAWKAAMQVEFDALSSIHWFLVPHLPIEYCGEQMGFQDKFNEMAVSKNTKPVFLGLEAIELQLVSSLESPAFKHPSLYRSTIGALQYLTLTRPDISFPVNKLNQHCKPQQICSGKRARRSLDTQSDANWGSSPDDRRSTSGCCVFLGPNLIQWSFHKQKVVACPTEAEYRALAQTAHEVACFPHGRNILNRMHTIREQVLAKKWWSVCTIKTSNCDLLTKPLSTAQFSSFQCIWCFSDEFATGSADF